MNHIYPEYIRKWKRLEYVGMTCSSPLGALALDYMSWFTYPIDSNSSSRSKVSKQPAKSKPSGPFVFCPPARAPGYEFSNLLVSTANAASNSGL